MPLSSVDSKYANIIKKHFPPVVNSYNGPISIMNHSLAVYPICGRVWQDRAKGLFLLCMGIFGLSSTLVQSADETSVSYYTQIRPIFQAKCHGCHQPAKPEGDYIMTHFEKMIQGGE